MISPLAYWRDPAGRHVGAADGLDLLHVAELLVVEQLVEVDDDLVEQSDALGSLVDVLGVELCEVGNTGEENPGVVPPLCEQILHPSLRPQVEFGHVKRQQVLN